MNCPDFHSYFENPLRLDVTIASTSQELSAHAGHCPDCSHFLEEQKKLAVSLRLARQSAPEVPISLDRAVLANYRRHLAERRASLRPAPLRTRFRPLSLLAWAAALAAAILVAQEEMALFFPGTGAVTVERPRVALNASPPRAPDAGTSSPAGVEKKPPQHGVLPTHRLHKPAVSRTREPESISPAFSSLLYCDPISCGGAMDVIRVELPSSVLRSSRPSTEASMVSADVLVGSDGIARAIRIVQ